MTGCRIVAIKILSNQFRFTKSNQKYPAMKKLQSILNQCFMRVDRPSRSSHLQKLKRLAMAGAAMLAANCLTPSAQAQTTIKPFQIRVEVPTGFSGTMLFTNNMMRVGTNGASPDITGTNWVIGSVTPTITGAPGGVTARFVDSGFVNTVGTIPINLNTNNGSKTTNLVVKLDFDGTQTGGISTLNLNLTGGVTSGYFPLVLEVGKIWNGSANAAVNGAGNWSDSSKWLGGAAPGPDDSVVFLDAGAQTNSLLGTTASTNFLTNIVVDASSVISSLRFAMTNLTGTPATNFHNIYINDNVTLAIKGPGGFSMLRDYTYLTVAAATRPNVTISGTNGTLIQTNESSNFSILIDGQLSGSFAFNSVLDMSGLGNLRLNVNRVAIGDILAYPNYNHFITNLYTPGSTFGSSRPSKCLPNWKMAMTNVMRSVYVDPYNYANALSRSYAMEIGRNETTGGSSGNFGVSMGLTNSFMLDGLCVAGYASLGGILNFTTSKSFALFRNTNGGRMSVFTCGDAAGSSATLALGNNTKCGNSGFGVDFTRGTVDVLVDKFYMSMDRGYTTGGGVCQSSLGMSAGIIDVNSAFIGYQSSGNQTNQNNCTATLTVTNTAVFKVNGNLALGYTTATAGDPSLPASTKGVIAIGPGGTVMASNITVGGTTKASTANAINLTAGAKLIVSNSIADSSPNGALGTLSFGGNCSLTLFIDGANPLPLVYVTNLSSTSIGNKLIIGGVKNLTYPADVQLIQGAGPAISAAVFDAGVVLPPGSGLSGTLSVSGNIISIHIINRAPNHLVWRGPGGTADWDYTAKNWLDQNSGIMTNYDNPDYVAFDNASGYAANINIAGGTGLTPTAINMTNSTLYYTFLDGGNQIIGGPAFNKYGNGTVEIDGTTSVAAQIHEGAMVGISSGSVGGVTVASGAVMNFAGSIGGSLNCSGTATSAGSISGTLTVLAGGVVTNSGTVGNPFSVQTGGWLYNTAFGALNNIGTGSSGSPQVASGGWFINNGSIGVNLGGNVLFVNGTFEDLGDGSITLQSVSVGAGGTFIPGGDGIGATTINNDGSTGFDGAALLALGSTNIFKVDAGSPANTVLTASHLSFGASASQQTQNGCTLVISNVSATPFSAGQTFQLFKNIFNSAIAPYSTGTSTNTFPVISPATPGAGLAWDLRPLWASGSIGVVAANSGPTLTNSFAGDGTGTNIVGQFTWDESNLGYRLQSQVTTLAVGLTATNWTGVAGSITNTTMTITNVIGPNSVFYRLTFP